VNPIDTLLAKLPDAKKSGNSWSARCPAHEDRKASLSVSEGEGGRALVHCHAGCTATAITAAIGLTVRDLMPERPNTSHNGQKEGRIFASYDYLDENRQLLFQAVRYDPKDFRQRRPDGNGGWFKNLDGVRRVPFRLPELLASPIDQPVYIVEGEKDVLALDALGLCATCNPMGAGKWKKLDDGMIGSAFRDRTVIVIPDNDDAGRKHAYDVVESLRDAAREVAILKLPGLPVKGDVSDWLSNGGTAEELIRLASEADRIGDEWERPTTSVITPGTLTPATRSRYAPDLVCLADVEPEKVPWLWPSRIPIGRLTVLVGRPGAGKSFVTCDLAARLSTSASWPDGDFSVAPLGDTLFICAEDDPGDTIVPRLIGAGADRRRVHLLKAAKIVEKNGEKKSVAFDLSNIDLIRDALISLPACRLVVIDPIGSYLGSGVDAHRDNEVRSVLAPLAALAAERGVAVLLVCHTRKAIANFADDAVLGSRAFVGLARSVLHLSADENDRDRKFLLPGKCNLGISPPGLAFRIIGDPARLEWEPELLENLHADDVIVPGSGNERSRGPEPVARDSAAKWLAELLKPGPMRVEDIMAQAKESGSSWRTIQRARELLGIVPHKPTYSGGWSWSLPEK